MPGLQDIGLPFFPDRFPESGTKNAPEYEPLHEALENSPVAQFYAKIISVRVPYLLFSLPICQVIYQPYLH